ncbi:DUF455-domain-containing protein [Gonapodya prolifera JEL478]|uniref:DUF455-domain-containing protein n=1 Tax=Gonapodya prolifera (strain JEL478) TaxID=1344416 RepID=A0A139APJ9_GONPJ|nr:DUF455-domain-containing protein [Gonapodya prolifera JEL478]|eukprot:KXS18433.1 DUF455-domain-containing protein [Gonapodya prolifera JEL478]
MDALPPELTAWAHHILTTPDPAQKTALTFAACRLWNSGQLSVGPARPLSIVPPRPEGVRLVAPRELQRRGKGGSVESRVRMLHSLASIEQWAVDLAWDIIARFAEYTVQAPDGTRHELERDFFDDFVRMAGEEANHFNLLRGRLKSLGTDFGALPSHAGLWESATTTSHDLLCRLVIVHMVHEARGLDVNPRTIAKFSSAGDAESVEKLDVIYRDEISHVATGTKHFERLARVVGVESVKTFHEIFWRHFKGNTKPPFNEEARREAGMAREMYWPLAEAGRDGASAGAGGGTCASGSAGDADADEKEDIEGEVSNEGAIYSKECRGWGRHFVC